MTPAANLNKNDKMKVNSRTLRKDLSALLDHVQGGGRVLIERRGRIVAVLVQATGRRSSVLGAMRGEFTMAEGWERPMSDQDAETFLSGR